jgi:hypothetical protein
MIATIQAERINDVSAALDALRMGREKIARGWTQGVYARNSTGAKVNPESEEATCWCAVGAIPRFVRGEHVHSEAMAALRWAIPVNQCVDVVGFNDADTATQSDVLALFDRAIAALETR